MNAKQTCYVLLAVIALLYGIYVAGLILGW